MRFFLLGLLLFTGSVAVQANESMNAGMEDVWSAVTLAIPPVDVGSWKVGDKAEYDVSAGFFGSGTMTKTAVSEEGNAIWVLESLQVPGHAEEIRKLFRRSDGEVLRVIRNGQEQNPADSKIQVKQREVVNVTVPAGTFPSLHIVGETKKGQIEFWQNPGVCVLEGSLKLIISGSFYTINSELKRSVRQR